MKVLLQQVELTVEQIISLNSEGMKNETAHSIKMF